MKKIKLNSSKLQLNKERIATLSDNQMGQIVGGWYTGGCTDGCGPFGSAWNCTLTACSANCSASFCPITFYQGPLQPTDQDCVADGVQTQQCPHW